MSTTEVRQAGEGSWVIENDSLRVHFQREGLALRVEDKRTSHAWRMEPEGASRGFTIVKLGIHIDKPLAELRLDEWREARERDFHGVELRSVQPDRIFEPDPERRAACREKTPSTGRSTTPDRDILRQL